jgi:uncharacterized membrane protein YgcG
MRFRACLPLVAALGLTSLAPVSVQAADEGWVITSFHAAIDINPDSSLDITENIQVDFGDQAKHGILRTIPVRYKYDSTHDRYYVLKVESVTNGVSPVPYQAYTQGPDEVIKIGDPSRTVTGPNTYVITYSVKGAMNAFEDHDELFWNVDGALWPVPKQSVSATVALPAAAYKAAACYQGATGSTEPCKYGNTTQSVTYSSTRTLASGEQMSVVVGLDKGMVKVPAPMLTGRQRQFPQDAFEVNPLTVGLSLLVLLAGLALIVRFWLLHGRDRAYLTRYYLAPTDAAERLEPVFQHEPVVVEFEPPLALKPAQLGVILDESADTKDVTATIVDLAVRGFMTITDVPGMFGRHDWLLTQKTANTAELLPYETTLLNGLFAGRQEVKISELKGKFQTSLRSAESQIYSDAMERKFFRVRPDLARMGVIGVAILFALAGAAITYVLGVGFGGGLIGVAVILDALVLLAVHRAMASRTAAGREAMQKTLGFRLYMTTAEKYRQQFAEKAEIFTQLLPYAIVFGCVSKWAHAFEGIDTSATNSWYVGNAPFQAALLSSSLESMNSGLSSAISASPPSSGSSSGFGGGGFSGGGGGGGGGGSW